MKKAPTSNDEARELAYEAARQVSRMVANLEARLFYIIRESVEADRGASLYAVQQAERVAMVRARLARAIGEDWQAILEETQQVLDEARQAGQGMAERDLAGREAKNLPALPPVMNNAFMLITFDTLQHLHELPALILRDATDVYQQVMAQQVFNLTAGALTRRQATQDALAAFAARGIESFTDRSGRRWRIDSYAEMATRTGAMHAFREGHLQHLTALGEDLATVAGRGYTCSKCAPWVGKVISLTGRTPTGRHWVEHGTTPGKRVLVTVAGSYEQAKAEGLFHPNCTHSLSLYVPGVTTLSPATDGHPATYEASQRQRALEREIRKEKRQLAAALTPEAAGEARAKINAYRRQIRELLADHPQLARKPERERATEPTRFKPRLLRR